MQCLPCCFPFLSPTNQGHLQPPGYQTGVSIN
jgi:hypothetical protein